MRQTNRAAFSLIEILVVIGIVVVLALILSSAMVGVQQRAAATADLANLRQIGIGALQYVGENNGRLAPVMASQDGKNIYAQELIARELGIYASLRSTNKATKEWGPFISPSDRRSPPLLSPLRCYAVNFYMGEIYTISNDSKIATHYTHIVKPSDVIYFLPMKSTLTNPDSQGRFSELTPPIVSVSGSSADIRFDKEGKTPALWADGHTSIITKVDLQTNSVKYIYPKLQR